MTPWDDLGLFHSIVNERLSPIGKKRPPSAAFRADTDISTVAGQSMTCSLVMAFSDKASQVAISEAQALHLWRA
jgi:hypothetical protein